MEEVHIDQNMNIEIEDYKSKKQSDNKYDEPLKLYKRFKKEYVEKDINDYKISRTFLYHYAEKLLTEKRSHNTEKSGSCHTDCK
ncbi:19161_t:CDS:2 [Racocetra fulgida]|uniref:19161_t:CDS:1 n=1 Tax=Racocetra fulgida TaxID=60492 RepID=A0A9N9BMG6_9GLOM|nr:19161_t:CDS:2 [Racocetra fulgida]